MNTREYFISKSPYIIINLIIYLLILVIMSIAKTPAIIMFIVFLIWFLPLLIYILIDLFIKKKFYDDIIGVTEKLDKKYLLPEVIKVPNYYEGKIIYETLMECNRNMHEHVNFYKNLQKEYREYVETWVHEIKTPISSSKLIIENSESKEKNALGDELKKIEEYINQALYYSRSTDVSNDYIIKEFEIKEAIQEAIRNNRRDFINKKIAVDIEEVSGTVVTDIKWIKFIVNQIIINSIKYSKTKNAILKAYTIKGKDNLMLIIEDNGIGIPQNDVNRVFDKGFTGENGRKYGKSTGIGLYLCKKLCEKLGLGISLSSEEGEGTKVNIIFPIGDFTSFK
ncbi:MULTISPECIES: sensor histidine kinase [unclassified Clostridium]|uniref:sensor histidine kinase n=1 Tax=unclassified Clostridium TaxID=2614128 RepID=UPI0002981984|nr:MULTISPECIES: sensor histidine kinase [unclassified Clostridium]EKQ51257.1 MAG: histidine kinase [Clostridium sp. Maddingley MBC34-26]